MIQFTLIEFFEAAVPIKAWFSWVPESILEELPKNTRLALAKIDECWIAIDEQFKVVYSESEVELLPSEAIYQLQYKIFASLMSDEPTQPIPLMTA